MRWGVLARAAAFMGGLALVAIALPPSEAGADEAKTAPSAAQCTVKGSEPVAKDTQIFDAKSGGKAIAKFTGATIALTMSDFPSDPTSARAKVSTSNGGASFRVDGYAAPSSFTFYTSKDIPVAGAHVWISSAQKVTPVASSNGQLTGELKISGSSQTVKGTSSCDAFTFTKPVATSMDVPGNGRGYLTKETSTELYDEAGGSVIFTLKMSEGSAQLFWSTEQKNGYVHVMSRADLTIDAWAKAKDLEPLKKGEMMDQLAPPASVVTGAQLALDKPPAIGKATRDVALRASRDAKAATIGAIEDGAEVYLMERVAGWVNVLPKSLALMPPEDGGFWIPESEAPPPEKP